MVRRKDSCSISAAFLSERITSTNSLYDLASNLEEKWDINFNLNPNSVFNSFIEDLKKAQQKLKSQNYYLISIKNYQSDHHFIVELFNTNIYIYQSFMSQYNFEDSVGINQKIFKVEDFKQ